MAAQQSTPDLLKQIDNQVVSLGILEGVGVKANKMFKNFLPVKLFLRVTKFAGGITKAHKANAGLTKAQIKANKQQKKSITIIQQLWVSMTAYGLSAKFAAKGTSTLGKAFMGLISSMLFIFGVIMLLVLGIGILTVVFADANSPLVQMIENSETLGPILNGLRIIITGEDGESGLSGSVDVLKVALIAAAAALILFGGPVAVIVGTLVLAVGMFRWAKNYFGSWVAGVIAVVGVLAAGIAVYIFFFVEMFVTVGAVTSATTAGIVAGFLAGVAMIAAGILGLWAYAKGAGDGIKGVVLGVVSGILLFLGMLLVGVSFAVAWPIALIAFLAATIYRYRDEILAGLTAAWDYLADLGSAIASGFVSGITWLAETIFAILVVGGQIIVALVMIPINIIIGLLTFLWSIPGMLFSLGMAIGEATLGPLQDLGAWIMSGIDWLLSLPGLIVDGVLDGLRRIDAAIRSAWNSHIALKIGPWTIPDWIPGVGGMTMPGLPPEMARGGVVSGPRSGYPATLHGTEAVIPLPDGRSIPVEMQGGGGAVYNINVDVSGIAVLSHRDKVNFAKEIGVLIKDEINKRNPFGM